MRWLLLILLVLSALEIGVFIWIGGLIGPWWVVLVIVLTGIIGMMLAKQQGMETWNRARLSMSNGQAPAEFIIDGICIFIGAVFLFTPGFITDTVGFLLIIPLTRKPFKKSIQKIAKQMMNKSTIIYRR
ncbi:membrane protein FxsA [Virgibacillus profundi]|uniref:Membrane protein FxsA n=1 Tax=Virgibacillus profundi TaxID=2024555 RepID=A0A2A2IF64_9BACI|nr:FxsA family protein [Virgibacillus profundi]PAV30399.1 membrane protein FxsA [Virgibacillus profundi]PXY54571.1 membrane protein FxsA [Virgibacillus profundi]